MATVLHTEVHTKIAELPRQEWDAIASQDYLPATYDYLAAVEQAGIAECEFLFPVVYDNGAIVAHAPA